MTAETAPTERHWQPSQVTSDADEEAKPITSAVE